MSTPPRPHRDPDAPARPAPGATRSTGASAADRPADEPSGPGAGVTASGRLDLGSIDVIRVLDEQGRVVDDRVPELGDEELLRVHRAMVLTRVLDQRMLAMQRQGEMGTFAPGLGQEATQIGQVYPLGPRDWFSPSYRSFGAQLWRGWTIEGLLLLWFGFFEGFEIPEGVNDLPFSIVIGSHVPVATGLAMAARQRGDDSVVVVNFGDGASSQGAVSEAMNFAAVSRAPIVFVCENNGWAISVPAASQAAVTELARRGPAFGMPGVRVDGNDVLAMIRAQDEAVARARAGDGPTFIEAVTYRMSYHTTADDPKVYRDEADVEVWNARCPIRRFEAHLAGRGLLDDDAIERVRDECNEAVLAARARFRERCVADPREVFDFMYEHLPPELAEQKDEYLKRLERRLSERD